MSDLTIDWRRLLDRLRVPWRDSGSNCSAGRIVISCPWCESDPGMHLSISEDGDGFYCLRGGKRHAGVSPVRLIAALGYTNRVAATALLNEYNTRLRSSVERKRLTTDQTAKQWQTFDLIANSQPHLEYMERRGFQSPAALSVRYDLRFAPAGVWAQRVLMPILDNRSVVVGWTGRAIRSHDPLRYLTPKAELHDHIYVPRGARDTVVIVEGPIDALKVAAATEALPISSVGIIGLGYEHKLPRLREVLVDCKRVLITLDRNVPLHVTNGLAAWLDGCLHGRYIKQFPLPLGFKDPGEMPLEALADWLREA